MIMIQLGHLRYLIAATENGSFRQAAEALRVQQSNVSRGIRHLEDQLGVSLFDRRHSGVQLTDAGRQFLDHALSAMEQLEFASKTAAAAGRVEIGVVRIGILTSLAGGFQRDLIRRYANRHPDVAIDIRDGNRREHIAAIRTGRLDIAFVTGASEIPDCETAELWRERVHVAMPREHALSPRSRVDWPELRREHFIVSKFAPGPEVHDYIVRRAADYSTYPEVERKAALQDTLMNLVALGQGITLVSAARTAVKFPDLVLRPLTNEADIISFGAVWSTRNDNPALRRLISVAHVLAGRVRRGCSDWSSHH